MRSSSRVLDLWEDSITIPNAIQFSAAYKRLLNHNEIKSSATANCIPLDTTNIFTVSSRKAVIHSNAINTDDINNDEVLMVTIPHSNINHIEGKEHAIICMAGFVERKLLKQITCETCLHLIYECATVESTFIKKKSYGYLHYPRVDTYKESLLQIKFSTYLK